MPWVPVIGNHDTYPSVGSGGGEGQGWDNDDKYFEEEFLYKWQEAEDIFPNWEKKPWEQFTNIPDLGKIGCQDWAFDIGPNHHLGLDFVKRHRGGQGIPTAILHRDNSKGTWDWLVDHIENLPNKHERLIVTAHHPLDFNITPGARHQFTCDATKKLMILFHQNEPEIVYWFGGHEQPGKTPGWGGDDYDDYWRAGLITLDYVYEQKAEVHFCSAVNRGTKSSTPPWTSVALVRVYSDLVCDFTLSDDTIYRNESVTVTSVSQNYSGSIDEYEWNFGDGFTNDSYGHPGQVQEHTYDDEGVFWIKHRITAGDKYAYMIRPVVVLPTPYPDPPHLWVDVVPAYEGGLMSYLLDPGDGGIYYVAYLNWTFSPSGSWYSWSDFSGYQAGRIAPNRNFPFFTWPAIPRPWFYDVLDPENLFEGETYTWQVDAYLNPDLNDENDSCQATVLSDTDTKHISDGGDGGGCPEVAVYHKDDTIQGLPYHIFLGNNTILPRSEILEYAGQVHLDLLKLEGLKPDADHYYLKVFENSDATSYLDQAKLWAVDHPEGTEIVTSSDGSIYVYSDVLKPLYCVDQDYNSLYSEVEYPDDSVFLSEDTSYLTVAFPENGWSDKGLLMGVGLPDGWETAPVPKDYYCVGHKPDGGGGWDPIPGGEAFARKKLSLWMADVSDVEENVFRINCFGDSCFLNYLALVKLDTNFTQTEAPLDSALFWYYDYGSWTSDNALGQVFQADSLFLELYPGEQLALRFDTLSSDTLLKDFVLQTSGYYIPGQVQGGGGQSSESADELVFDLYTQQIQPLTKDVSIRYTVPYKSYVKIGVYDVQGRLVSRIVDGRVTRGIHELVWKGKDDAGRSISSGIYFIRMNAGEFEEQKKIVVLR